MGKDSGGIAQRETGRRTYSAPELTVFGAAVELTANGSGTKLEYSTERPARCDDGRNSGYWTQYNCSSWNNDRG